MRVPSFIPLLLLPFVHATTSDPPPTLSTISVLLWPPSAPSPAPYVDISFALPNSAVQITKRHPLPSIDASDEFVRLGFLRPDLVDAKNPITAWAGIAVSPEAVASDHNVTVELLVTRSGSLYHLGLKSEKEPLPKVRKGQQAPVVEGWVRASIKQDQVGNKPVLNRPVVLNKEGKVDGEEVDNRSFLQKYWWAIAIFLVMQVVMGGGDGK
ncbi:hypothetical protein K461DRAFT_282644 [Myriangium duriaei CBS 260.36]|uniref:Uncharacterized protein n=1 Tax=Myriangium duriaei CBS 260.36 TaxID=1168546 RepID=A0A9P4IT56_9PEZI|nr:hypothetical protein K461DRAFT_282644 [Myriangium duriaei CBS 260.36]